MKKTPGIAQWILSRLAGNSVRDSLLGDLEEQFHLIAEYSVVRTHLWYWLQVFRSLPALLGETFYWSRVMFKNYLKVAFRNLLRHKSYTFINVSGLAIGIACCLLILMYIQHEIRYEKFHKDADRIYRVTTEISWSGGYEKGAGAQFPVATALLNDYPAVESACRLFRITQPNPTLRFGDKQFLEEEFFQADTNFFDFFGGEFVAGNPATALKQVNGVVITEKIADKYFGKQVPLGKLLTFNNSITLQVTGVVKEMPDNSHLKFDLIMSFA
ncbi:MAG: ABC transporter permease, partial [Calditrichaeota bacterium]|nr:ABC transporter permease [Calditrichota bacterium]